MKSEVVEDSESPMWTSATAIFYRSDPSKPIKVQVWNSNLVVDSFMGQGMVMAPPAASADSKTVTERIDLFGRRKKKAEAMPGKITVEIESFEDLNLL